MPGVCTHCGSSDIDTDSARGDAVCTNCGSVLEDNIIVSEVQFAENAGGGSSIIGQFVSSEGQKSHSLGPGFHSGFGRESRAITLQNGKKRLQTVGAQLKLNNYCIDTAFNFYKMAVARRLTYGRKHGHVIAACLYIVCRTEGTSHMLLDFSDVLQENVYTLGRTYLALSRALCINIPALDPCIYIQRFAHKLEFGDKTHEVSMTALRLVQRMKRDWIHAGRRPSGLCGAALVVAARLHDFGRTVRDVIKVAKVCETTLRKRLTEFEDTPSSQLTIDEFQRIDLEEEHDPPAFLASKRKAKLLAELEANGELGKISSEIQEVQELIERALETPIRGKKFKTVEEEVKDSEEQAEAEKFLIEEVYNTEVSENDVFSPLKNDEPSTSQEDCSGDEFVQRLESDEMNHLDSTLGICHTAGPRPTPASLGLKETIEECMAVKEDTVVNEGNGELDLEGIDDEEIDRLYILSREEVVVKARMWLVANSDYLKEQREKRQKEKEDAEKGIVDKKKKRPRKKQVHINASSAGEAIERVVQEKKISSKINYDVLRSLTSDRSEAPPCDPMEALLAEPIVESGPVQKLERRKRPADKRPETKSKIAKIEPEKLEPDAIVENGPVVETGPIDYDGGDLEEEFSEDESQHVSAAQLMGRAVNVDDYEDDY